MSRYVVLAILAALVVTGVSISGCNRNRDNRVASNARNRQAQGTSARRTGNNQPVRPAEVLSASVHRRNRPRRSPSVMHDMARNGDYYASRAPVATVTPMAPVQPAQYYSPVPQPVMPAAPRYEYAYGNEPLPEPVPVSHLYMASNGAAPSGTFHSQPYYLEPIQTSALPAGPVTVSPPGPVYTMAQPAYMAPAHPTPELALARAALEPMTMTPGRMTKPVSYPGGFVNPEPAAPVCYPTPQGTEVCYPVPIPELEPVRYSRVASWSSAPSTQASPMPMLQPLASTQTAPVQPVFQPLRETASQTMSRPGAIQPAHYTPPAQVPAPARRPDWSSRQNAMEPLKGWVPSPTTASR